jgi:hypothetical protein
MNGGIHIGDNFSVGGTGNIGKIENSGQTNTDAALRDVQEKVSILRANLAPDHLAVVDSALQQLGPGSNASAEIQRSALARIAGIATVVGSIGTPAVEAIRRLIDALH